MSSNAIEVAPAGQPGADAPNADDYRNLLRGLGEYAAELTRRVELRRTALARLSAARRARGAVGELGDDGAYARTILALLSVRRVSRLLADEPMPARPALLRTIARIGRNLGIAAQFGAGGWEHCTSAEIHAFCARAARTGAGPRRRS